MSVYLLTLNLYNVYISACDNVLNTDSPYGKETLLSGDNTRNSLGRPTKRQHSASNTVLQNSVLTKNRSITYFGEGG